MYIIFYKIYRKTINCSWLIKKAIVEIYLKNHYQNGKITKKFLSKYINRRVNYFYKNFFFIKILLMSWLIIFIFTINTINTINTIFYNY